MKYQQRINFCGTNMPGKTQEDCGEPSISSLKYEEEWLTTKQAAEYLKVSIPTLWNMSSNGHIQYHKLGRRNRYSLVELRKFLLLQKRGGFYGNKF